MDGPSIVKRINNLLKQKKISKTQFYKDCEISSAGFSQWNKEKTFPTQKNLQTIAEYLGVTAQYLLTGENGQKNTATTNSDGTSLSDIELLNAFKSSDEATQELIRRVLGLQ